MLQKILIFASCIWFVYGVSILPCKTGVTMPLSLTVDGCDDFPCNMYKGDFAVCNVTFIVPEDTDSMKATIQAKVGPINAKYPIPDNEVCHSLLNGYCPVEAGERIVYSLRVEILKAFPKVKFEMETTLTNPNTNTNVVCFKIVGQVVDRH